MTFRKSGAWFFIGLFAGVVLLAGATLAFVQVTVERLIRADAESAVANWKRHFALNLPDFADIAAGRAPLPGSAAFLAAHRHGMRIVRYQLCDTAGHIRLTSDEIEGQVRTGGTVVDPVAGEVAATAHPKTVLEHTDPLAPKSLFAVSYQPILVRGTVAGVFKAYVDQTEKSAGFDRLLSMVGMAFAALITLAFAAPAIVLQVRSRQKEAAEQTAEFLAIERKVAQVRNEFLAQRDELTRLMNRATLLARLSKRLARLPESGHTLAIHNIDIDQLRRINDEHGYDIGDGLIRAVAETLSGAIGECDLVGRISGNGFLIIQDEIEQPATALRFARRLKDALDRPFVVKGLDLVCGASIGLAIAPAHGTTAEALLHSSELALKSACSPGVRADVCLFEVGMEAQIRRRHELEALVRDAAANEAFELHFQPVVRARTGRPAYFEALLRLPRPDGSYVPPTVFVPIAEDLGLINAIGAWALNRAAAAAAAWPQPLGVAVNLSPAQFANADLCRIVTDALAASGLDPHRLELEITEGLLLRDTESVLGQLQTLRAIGVSTAMDDFGTGYSSLGYLWRFPFDKIKIDRSFMIGWEARDQHISHILRTIVALGHTLDMQVTAEGVEMAEQAALLRGMGCDFLQGFHFSRPLPEAEVAPYLMRAVLLSAFGDPPPRRAALQLVTAR
ncbi:putative bifunctional diguanylate cyclase/phosphodiesterase [Blastochloris viridis]|uniref:Bacteriophytochrome cph2 n=1 Tax=Blastochloris viridis TaxID=1079 RepID=A0A0H5BAI1_BLAVI|nr:GGDEF domain-containing phosphodiesterase [Blastochloris viridis]ALK08653.1 Phytochrome-like protein cph2 [Blastochloris viridis]BAR98054.1 diguanylate cyclase/phosphodiesterase with PAS/PAC sensor [Blastochloris viridis]CUU41316.1 Bacteriophytochrome cph2 [Blastochloris viridis]